MCLHARNGQEMSEGELQRLINTTGTFHVDEVILVTMLMLDMELAVTRALGKVPMLLLEEVALRRGVRRRCG